MTNNNHLNFRKENCDQMVRAPAASAVVFSSPRVDHHLESFRDHQLEIFVLPIFLQQIQTIPLCHCSQQLRGTRTEIKQLFNTLL